MMQASNFNYRNFKAMRGMAAVEFTLLMAFVFSPLVLGTIEIGRVLYQYNSVAKSVRDGARFISLFRVTDPTYAAQVTIARCLVAFGNATCTGNPIAPGLSAGQVTITNAAAGGAGTVVLRLVTVTVTGYRLGYVTSIFVNGGSKAFNNISVVMRT